MSPSFFHALTEADPFFGDEYQIRPQESGAALKKVPIPQSLFGKKVTLNGMHGDGDVVGLAFNEAEAKLYSKCI